MEKSIFLCLVCVTAKVCNDEQQFAAAVDMLFVTSLMAYKLL